MRVSLLLLALCVAAVCVLAADDPQNEQKWGNRNGYIVNPGFPKDKKYPLMLWYHGMGQYCPWQTQWCSNWQRGLRDRGIIMHCVALCADGDWDNGGNKDIDLTRTVIDWMAQNYNIDKSKVFASGWSWGGMFISHMVGSTGTSIVQGLSPHCCAYGVGDAPVHYLGYQSQYDDRCGSWVTNSWQDSVKKQGCNAGSGDHRQLVCKGKEYEYHQYPVGHSIMDYSTQGPEWIKRILGGTGPSPTPSASNCGITAQEGDSLSLNCDADQWISSVDFASYGTPTGDCSQGFKASTCHSDKSQSVMESKCLGQNKCTVAGNNDVFGDPCVGTGKKLAAKATCGPALKADVTCATAAENANLALGCTGGKKISKVTFASYGTPSADCPSPASNSTCHSSKSQAQVEAACLGKLSCSVPATNAVFDDPCVTIIKKLTVSVTCA